jgi:hypothetical protein
MDHPSPFPISRLSAAESVAALLGRLDVSAFPWEEKLAVGACQVRAIDEWLEAYSETRQCAEEGAPAVLRCGPLLRLVP